MALHRSDFKIVKVIKEGYYTYYEVSSRLLFFFWNSERHFDSIEEAERWITNQLVVERREVVG